MDLSGLNANKPYTFVNDKLADSDGAHIEHRTKEPQKARRRAQGDKKRDKQPSKDPKGNTSGTQGA